MIPSNDIKRQLYIYDWPGNVDELKRLVYRVADAGDESIVKLNGVLSENAQTKMALPDADVSIRGLAGSS